jgi:hypothetical protein
MNDWKPEKNAVWQEPAVGPARSIRHPTAPYVAQWKSVSDWMGLAHIANDYLKKVAPNIGLTGAELRTLRDSVAEKPARTLDKLAWLEPQEKCSEAETDFSSAQHFDPHSSYWIRRAVGDKIEKTFVLLGQRLPKDPYEAQSTVRGSGIRVVMHLQPIAKGGGDSVEVRITGVTTSLLDTDDGFGSIEDTDPESEEETNSAPSEKASQQSVSSSSAATKVEYRVIKFPVFDQDPVSKNGAETFATFRPSRPSAVFEGQREVVSTVGEHRDDGRIALHNACVTVIPSKFVEEDRTKGASAPKGASCLYKTVSVETTPVVRSNDAAALSAFYNTNQFIERIFAYGFTPTSYLRSVDLPLRVFYRGGAGIGEDRGSKAINARVRRHREIRRITIAPARTIGGKVGRAKEVKRERFRADISFALADRTLSPATHPLGIASDPRWCWHEMGHVLLIGTTGAREFRFAHSPGDALAAILSDPRSKLASDDMWRGVTFPWVLTKRRHDRSVADGWSWTGPLYQREDFYAPLGEGQRAYWAEQLLSSTLFTLYRALGGDARNSDGTINVAAREAAANYTVYLIFRAIALLGPAGVVEAQSPDEFVSALIDADIGTSMFVYPHGNEGARPRIGGTAHKVIRWAFAAQGLYGERDKDPVDIFVADCRPEKGCDYRPVSFQDSKWYASSDGIRCVRVNDTRRVDVTVKNASPSNAMAVSVWLYWAIVEKTGVPDFPANESIWHPVQQVAAPKKLGAIPGKGKMQFKFLLKDAPCDKTIAILAVASCPADRANIDPEAKLPCGTIAGPVEYLVACDNNLGLLIDPPIES